jgi:hypothetical protein
MGAVDALLLMRTYSEHRGVCMCSVVCGVAMRLILFWVREGGKIGQWLEILLQLHLGILDD